MMPDQIVEPRTDEPDPVVEAYKRDIDQTLLVESLKLTPDERIRSLIALHEFSSELRDAMCRSKGSSRQTSSSYCTRFRIMRWNSFSLADSPAHGSVRNTQDVDIVYCRTAENIQRLVAALQPLSPYLRGAPIQSSCLALVKPRRQTIR
jgi:hypothetical protein